MNHPSIRITVVFYEARLLSEGLAQMMLECHLAPDGKVKNADGNVVGSWARHEADGG